MSWKPELGAWRENAGVRFRVWAPGARSIDLVLESPNSPLKLIPLLPTEDGYFTGTIPGLKTGTWYRYRMDEERSLPDPASRFQPQGVHGPSEVVDPARFHWTDTHWQGLPLEKIILYEIHVGTFTPEGTFAGVQKRLQSLKEIGITAIELMPVADFPGERNWGYDGVDLFAPARCYGKPDDLRQLVNAAHGLGIAVVLDVVYNHLGPEGAYVGAFSPYYFSSKHKSPWGDAVNLDDTHCEAVRNFFIENALHWVHEYHIDGLRLDATHTMMDNSPTHFLKELADRVRSSLTKNRTVLVIAEDERNEVRLVEQVKSGGFGLDAVWADDFHHQIRSLLSGDNEGYFQEFTGSTKDIAMTLAQGWFYTGQHSKFKKALRGTNPKGIPLQRFIHCIQNHDQVGNRALGDRLNSSTSLAAYRAVSALLLLSPATPLLFMGQEWAATSPFCYFTDHPEKLGAQVFEGRKMEFRHFKEFLDSESGPGVPDPQSQDTFMKSKLDWEEKNREPHAGLVRLYTALIHFRLKEPALGSQPDSIFHISEIGDSMVAFKRELPGQPSIGCIVCLKNQGSVNLGTHPVTRPPESRDWEILLTTEDKQFARDSSPPRCEKNQDEIVIHFSGPCAVILRSTGLETLSK